MFFNSVEKKIFFLACIILLFNNCVKNNLPAGEVSVFRNIEIEEILFSSVAEVRIHRKNGENASCTAFPYQKNNNKYLFIVSAHCVAYVDPETNKIEITAQEIQLDFKFNPYLRQKEYKAKIIAVGNKLMDDDFAILEVKVPFNIPIFSFSEKKAKVGGCVINLSYPAEADGDISYGVITNLFNHSTWFSSKLSGMKKAQGASGSPIVDCVSGQVLGIITQDNKENGDYVVRSITIDKFIEFEQLVEMGEYPY